mgnify:CR=1 FL=1
MKVPHILIAGWPVVLAGGNALAAESLLHCPRQTTGGAKAGRAELVRDVEQVLMVLAWREQAVAADPGVVVQRHESEHFGFDEHDRFRWRSGRQRLGNAAERAVVSGRCVLHVDMVGKGGSCGQHRGRTTLTRQDQTCCRRPDQSQSIRHMGYQGHEGRLSVRAG